MIALINIGLRVALLYGVLCGALYLLQGLLLYHPTPEIPRPGTGSITLERGAVALKVWELHPQARPALLYFGGNAEDVGANIPDFERAFPDRAVYLMNYRGYGGSTGRPSEKTLITDAEALYDWVAARHDRIAVIGRSLGSGVATALATQRPVERLVLVTPFDSIVNVAADHFRWLPVRLLLRDRYDSRSRIGAVRAPVLALVAERDEVVWRARSDALIAAIPSAQRQVVVVAGATHNDISSFPEYFRAIVRFLQTSQ
jgi:uncharacterized protein